MGRSSSFDSALDQILSNPALKDGNWKKVGVGIAQDAEGIIKFTLSYTEWPLLYINQSA